MKYYKVLFYGAISGISPTHFYASTSKKAIHDKFKTDGLPHHSFDKVVEIQETTFLEYEKANPNFKESI